MYFIHMYYNAKKIYLKSFKKTDQTEVGLDSLEDAFHSTRQPLISQQMR